MSLFPLTPPFSSGLELLDREEVPVKEGRGSGVFVLELMRQVCSLSSSRV